MSHLAPVSKTPRKRTHQKAQSNTLDKYFGSKQKLESKSVSADKNLENGQALSTAKKKIQSKNIDCNAKHVNADDTLQQKASKAITYDCKITGEVKVSLKRLNTSGIETSANSGFQYSDKASLTFDQGVQSSQKEDGSPKIINPLKRNRTVAKNARNRITAIISEAVDKKENFSLDDSVEIEPISTPKKPKICQTDVEYKPNISLLPMNGTSTEIITGSHYGISDSRKSQDEVKLEFSKSPVAKTLQLQERKKVSASSFKEIVQSFCYSDFLKPYKKLKYYKLPICYDLEKCCTAHGGGFQPKIVNSFQYGHLFNNLDSPLHEWLHDILPAIALVVNRDQHLRGDMLRVMFDYVLNGPNIDVMWDVQTILKTHWSLHPPCSDHMQNFYLELLDMSYPHESYFKTDLTNCGVLHHVMDQMEKISLSEIVAQEDSNKNNENNNIEENNSISEHKKVTYDILQERFDNHQPLLEEERLEDVITLEEMLNTSQEDRALVAVVDSEALNRLTSALDIIIDLLEADFLICVSRLKHCLKEECVVREPLIKHFMDDSFQSRILKFYVTTTNKATWNHISRLIGLMAETRHLFAHDFKKVWIYPNLNPGCEEFASVVFKELSKGCWDDSERLCRLQNLQPPWLQQRVTLMVANSQLNLDLGAGIQAMVDIIHTHVISPVKLKKDLIKVEIDQDNLKIFSEKLMKKSHKKNQYGETLLHRVCRGKNFSVEDVESVLALPETDVNVKDNYGWTPLHEAVGKSALAKVELLLQYQPPPGSGKLSADAGAQNNDGISPLHEAVQMNNLEICHLLVRNGGICLLRKKNNEGVTPLMLAKHRDEIRTYFESEIKIQEELNLNSNSVLRLSDAMIRMCMVVCEAFIADHHTWEVYQVIKYDKDYKRAAPQTWVAADSKDVLLQFKKDQDHFRKLRKILEKLAENPENSYLVRVWNDRFFYREDMKA